MAEDKATTNVLFRLIMLSLWFVWIAWPLVLLAILVKIPGVPAALGFFPGYAKMVTGMFAGPVMVEKVHFWVEVGEIVIWCIICYWPLANLLNGLLGSEFLPSFRGFVLFLRRFKVVDALLGGGKAKAGPVPEGLDRRLIQEIADTKPQHVLTGFIGREPVFTTDKQRTQHTQVIGSSGSGKTESVIKNWAYQDMARGRGFTLLDPKGDVRMAAEMFHIGKDRKIFYLSLLHDCKYSQTYNPLAYGDPSQCANKIFNSFDWESDYYKMRAFDFYQSLLRILFRHRGRVLLGETLPFMRDPRQCEDLSKSVTDMEDRAELAQLARTRAEDLSGLYSKLSMLCRSETVSKVFAGSDINVKTIVDTNSILLCQLPTSAYTVEARAIARMVIQDLNLVSAYRQQDLGKKEFYPVFIDEFNSFIFDGFLDFLEKARSANMGLVLAHQSLANLERINPAYKKQIFENCSTKIIMSHNDPDSAKYISQAIGEYYHKAETKTDSESAEVMGLDMRQGKAVSVREEKRFIVEPTTIMALKVGQGYYLSAGGSVARVQMRHFGPYYKEEMYNMDFLNKIKSNTEIQSNSENQSNANNQTNTKKGEIPHADHTQAAGPAGPGNHQGPGRTQNPDRSGQSSEGGQEGHAERENQERPAGPKTQGNSERPEF